MNSAAEVVMAEVLDLSVSNTGKLCGGSLVFFP
jgi:hypothetical protein